MKPKNKNKRLFLRQKLYDAEVSKNSALGRSTTKPGSVKKL